jgi:hypothetical protein
MKNPECTSGLSGAVDRGMHAERRDWGLLNRRGKLDRPERGRAAGRLCRKPGLDMEPVVFCLALLALTLAPTLQAGVVSWAGGSGDWNTATNWSTGTLPGPDDEVVINSALGASTITHSSGAHSVKSLVSQCAFQLTGGSLTILQTCEIDHDFTLAGGTLARATVLAGTNGASVIVNGSGVLDVGSSFRGSRLTVTNGLVLNGTAYVGGLVDVLSYGAIGFLGSQALSGNGEVVFGLSPYSVCCDYPSYNAVYVLNPEATLTLGAGITVRGKNGV